MTKMKDAKSKRYYSSGEESQTRSDMYTNHRRQGPIQTTEDICLTKYEINFQLKNWLSQ